MVSCEQKGGARAGTSAVLEALADHPHRECAEWLRSQRGLGSSKIFVSGRRIESFVLKHLFDLPEVNVAPMDKVSFIRLIGVIDILSPTYAGNFSELEITRLLEAAFPG